MSNKNEPDKKSIENLKMGVIDKLLILIKFNREETKKLVFKYFDDKINPILKKLEKMPDMQLEIVERYISTRTNNEENKEIDPEILKKHISLLSQTNKANKKRIREILQTSSTQGIIYPVQPCLEICKKFDVKDAWAYLEFRQGNITGAIEISFKILDNKIKEYVRRENFDYS